MTHDDRTWFLDHPGHDTRQRPATAEEIARHDCTVLPCQVVPPGWVDSWVAFITQMEPGKRLVEITHMAVWSA